MNSKKAMMTIGAGLLAGGVAGYLLNSDRGRQVRHDAQEGLKSSANQAYSKMGDLAGSARNYVNDLASSVRSKVSEYSSDGHGQAQKSARRISGKTHQVENNVKSGHPV